MKSDVEVECGGKKTLEHTYILEKEVKNPLNVAYDLKNEPENLVKGEFATPYFYSLVIL